MATSSLQCPVLGPGTLLWRSASPDACLSYRAYHSALELGLQQRAWDLKPERRYATLGGAGAPLRADLETAQAFLWRVKSLLQKTVRLVARTAVITSVASAVGLFVACEFDDAKTLAAIVSIPRTVAAIRWGISAAGVYRRVLDEYEVHQPRGAAASSRALLC